MAALGVDRLLWTSTVVVRPLPRLVPARKLVVGSFLDALSLPRLVLDPEHLVAAASAGSASSDPEPAPAHRILVVDDSLTTRMLEQSILETAGYEVDLAASAEEGFQMARARPYAAFLVDVEMPGLNGFELLERFRSEPGLRDIPSILVTSRWSQSDRRRGEQAGARAYVEKGEFDQVELLRRIRSLLA